MNLNLLSNVFNEIGMSDFDLKIYLDILDQPNIKVSHLSKKYTVSRVRIYQTLKNLQKNELIPQSDDSSFILRPLSPESLIGKLKHKENSIQSLSKKFKSTIPDLLGVYSFGENKNNIQYKGIGEMVQLLYTMVEKIPSGGEYLWFNEGTELSLFFRDFFFGEYSKNRAKRNIKVRILANYNNTVLKSHIKNGDEELRQLKYLPENFPESATFTIFLDTVIFWNISIQKAYLIKDSQITANLKTVFNSFWNNQEI